MKHLAALVAVPLLLPACGSAQAGAATEVVLDIHHSKFSANAVTVRRGVPITFVVRNADPIAHELIVGDRDLQLRHERGTEPAHGDRAGEVSVPLGQTATTRITFAERGTYYFACHLPGHYSYGMRGIVTVR